MKFARYWSLIHIFSAFSRKMWLRAIKHRTENVTKGCKLHFISGGVIATLWAPVQPVQARADPRGGHGDRVA